MYMSCWQPEPVHLGQQLGVPILPRLYSESPIARSLDRMMADKNKYIQITAQVIYRKIAQQTRSIGTCFAFPL